jgi:hypothetical protein
VEAIPTPEEEISKIQHLDIKPQTKLVGEEVRTIEQNVNIEPLVFSRLGLQHYGRGNKCLKGYRILSFHLYHFIRILGMESKVQRG